MLHLIICFIGHIKGTTKSTFREVFFCSIFHISFNRFVSLIQAQQLVGRRQDGQGHGF